MNPVAEKKSGLPPFNDAWTATLNKRATALERFIADWEPPGFKAAQWRSQLRDAIAEAKNDRYEDMTDDPAYQAFVESMAQYCHCADRYKPCDGVLAGGLCDDMGHDERDDPLYSDEYDDL